MEERKLPRFSYYLDEADPDIAILRRQDGSFVAAFSAQGATKESIREAAEADYVALTQQQERILELERKLEKRSKRG
jgi:hypothetical protein